MQLELELRWYTDQLGMLEDLVSREITEWVWLHSCGRMGLQPHPLCLFTRNKAYKTEVAPRLLFNSAVPSLAVIAL